MMPAILAVSNQRQLAQINQQIVSCRKCPRLVEHREQVARTKRRAYRDWIYWGRPVPGFGDSTAELLVIGLAPAAHGGNRTGRIFTGDRSGDFLYQMLYRTGFSNQPASTRRDDGLKLSNAYVAAAVRCAPPKNRPRPEEMDHCQPYLVRELEVLRPRAVLALGRIAFDRYLRILKVHGEIPRRKAYRFSHGACFDLSRERPSSGAALPCLFASYHPSQQNTQTGRLTPEMFLRVLRRIRRFFETSKTASSSERSRSRRASARLRVCPDQLL